MRTKTTYLLEISDSAQPLIKGIGEIALFEGLSSEDGADFERRLVHALQNIEDFREQRYADSSVAFGIETALANLVLGGKAVFPSPLLDGNGTVIINGLIWMGRKDQMLQRIGEKMEQGFRCLKLKIGGIDFDDEIELLSMIRSHYGSEKLELRLDCNGSLSRLPFNEAVHALERLAQFRPHSIEQPFAAADVEHTRRVCSLNIVPIALDEQLIGVTPDDYKQRLLDFIKASYVVIKPSLCGGFAQAQRWIDYAKEREMGWWVTSALESAIGLNAIAQWTSALNPSIAQGLGTGELYVNDFHSPLKRNGERLTYMPDEGRKSWNLENVEWIDV